MQFILKISLPKSCKAALNLAYKDTVPQATVYTNTVPQSIAVF